MNENYYLVKVKCGHVGKNYYIEKTLPIVASNAKEAARIARNTPRVKHDDKEAILNVYKVNEETYNYKLDLNHKDQYFSSHSKQDDKPILDELSSLKKKEWYKDDEYYLKEIEKERSIKKRTSSKKFIEKEFRRIERKKEHKLSLRRFIPVAKEFSLY